MLTQNQIQEPMDVKVLFNTTADCLCFVTEFFEVISQSVPHIYHSALWLAPQSSIVWELYSQKIYSPPGRIVTGKPASWDLCTASTWGVNGSISWSPCGQFIATIAQSTIQVLDSNTLARVSVLKPPSHLAADDLRSPTFSPDGCLIRKNPATSFG